MKEELLPISISDSMLLCSFLEYQDLGFIFCTIASAVKTGDFTPPEDCDLPENITSQLMKELLEKAEEIHRQNQTGHHPSAGGVGDFLSYDDGGFLDYVRAHPRGQSAHAHTCGLSDKTDNREEEIEEEIEDRQSAHAHKRENVISNFPDYPKPPNAIETIWRTAVENGFPISADEAVNFFTVMADNQWRDQDGRPIRDWKRVLLSWRFNQKPEYKSAGEAMLKKCRKENGILITPEDIKKADCMINGNWEK